jgi:hypothetical protein
MSGLGKAQLLASLNRRPTMRWFLCKGAGVDKPILIASSLSPSVYQSIAHYPVCSWITPYAEGEIPRMRNRFSVSVSRSDAERSVKLAGSPDRLSFSHSPNYCDGDHALL